MKKFIIYFLVGFFFLSCNNEKKNTQTMEKPKELIPREKMILIITDLQLAESLVIVKQSQGKNGMYYTIQNYKTLIKKHEVSPKIFKESINYYSYNISELSAIYAEVITNLSLKQSEAKYK